jgi:two-component system response regulator DesR
MSVGRDARVRVVVADDHPSIRENLKYILSSEPDMLVVALARDGAEAVRAALAHRPDVIVVDADMPILDGLKVTIQLRREAPEVCVILYTATTEVCGVAYAAGAFGCVPKDAPMEVLIQAIRDGAADVAQRR